eukprot:jgi/Botrbrau1/7463/Bobra.0095s0002.1
MRQRDARPGMPTLAYTSQVSVPAKIPHMPGFRNHPGNLGAGPPIRLRGWPLYLIRLRESGVRLVRSPALPPSTPAQLSWVARYRQRLDCSLQEPVRTLAPPANSCRQRLDCSLQEPVRPLAPPGPLDTEDTSSCLTAPVLKPGSNKYWQYSVRKGLNAVLTSAHQRVTLEPAFPTPVPGEERRRAELWLHAGEEGRNLYVGIVGSSPLTPANLQHFIAGGAAARAAKDKQTRYTVLLARQETLVAFQAFSFETFGGLHADALALLQRFQGLLKADALAFLQRFEGACEPSHHCTGRCGGIFCQAWGQFHCSGCCGSPAAARRV